MCDHKESVRENRRRLSKALTLPGEPHWLNQIHSTLVHEVDSSEPASPLSCDGSSTSLSGVVCAVLTADCLPLFLSDRKGSRVAIVHAGWRGMADGIVDAGVLAFNTEPDDIIAWAGPCISGQHFEIGDEVRTALGGSDKAYRESPNSGKWLADLYQLAGERLAALGVSDYGHSSACTFRDHERFYSYRRDGECGRMASLIWLESRA